MSGTGRQVRCLARCWWEKTGPSITLSLLLVVPECVCAQAQEDSDALQEVVVTAQKRAENLQEVPIAITALSAKALEDRGLTNVAQLSSYAPNVQFDNTSAFAGSSQVLSASIRGIGQNDFAFNLEPGVGVYIDGVYFARSLGAVVDLLDLDHVEILKGPQGTLFGRNTIGGALSVVTRKPAETFGYKAEFTAGSFNRRDVRGSVDLPLISGTLLSQISFSSKRADGYAERIPFPGASNFETDRGRFITAAPPGGPNEQGNENVQNLRAKLLWRISDRMDLLLEGDYTNVDQEAIPWTLLDTNAGPTSGTVMGAYNACISLPVATLSSLGLGGICGTRATVNTSFAGANADADPNNNRLTYGNQYITRNIDRNYGVGGNNFDRMKAWGGSATLDWTLRGSWKLKSITAVRGLSSVFGDDIIGSPLLVNDSSFSMDQHQLSQELQLTSSGFGERLKNLFGLYYFRETGDLIDYPIFGEGLIQIYGPNFFLNKAYAGFAHEQFKLTERLTATLGVRYTREDKQFEGQQHDLNSFFLKAGFPPALLPDPNDPTRIYPLGINRKSFTNTSPRVGFDYELTDRAMTYLSYSKGFKSGGWTTRLLAPAPGNIAPSFEPEKARTCELGVKSELWDRRVRVNTAAFYTNYDDLQVLVYQGISPVFENAGKAVIKGLELESEGRLLHDLGFTANVGFLDAYYTQLRPGTLVTLQDQLVNAPRWSYLFGLDYTVHLPDSAALILRTDYSHKSNMARDALNSQYLFSGNVNNLNASIGYTAGSGVWELVAGGRNLTDRRVIVAGYDQMASGQIGDVSATYSRPREWYVTLRVHP